MKAAYLLFPLTALTLLSCGQKPGPEPEKSSEPASISQESTSSESSATSSLESSETSISTESGSSSEEEALAIHFLEMSDVYGDSFIIKLGNVEILVDGGQANDGYNVRQSIKKYVTDGVLDMLIVSHPHSDHTAGLSDRNVFREVTSIGTIIDYGYQYSTEFNEGYQRNREKYIGLGASYYPAYNLFHEEGASPIFNITDDCYLEVLNTDGYLPPDDVKGSSYNHNDGSVAVALTYKDTKFFFAGDLEKKGERAIISHYPNYFKDSYTFFKASHHGSETSNSIELLDYLKPEYIFISAAVTPSNMTSAGVTSEQHPYISTLRNFANYTDKVYWNGTSGSITAICDGSKITSVTGAGATRKYYSGGAIVDSSFEANKPFPQTKWYADYLKLR